MARDGDERVLEAKGAGFEEENVESRVGGEEGGEGEAGGAGAEDDVGVYGGGGGGDVHFSYIQTLVSNLL